MSSSTISALEALRALMEQPGRVSAIDVRSEGEFAEAAVPGFCNLPILTDPERHEVGTCYKQQGQEAAIELGHRLTGPHRSERTEGWRRALEEAEIPLVTCFRGGLRSQLACSWIEEAGQNTLRVDGGYKAMRGELKGQVDRAPELVVLSGPTGSGKSELLRGLTAPSLDLEALANHKGSAFGGSLLGPQPAQATFENSIGMALMKRTPSLVEDESAMIGQLCVPLSLRQRISSGKVVRIRMEAGERAGRIYREYLLGPIAQGVHPEQLASHYQQALRRIERRLGGLATAETAKKMSEAFHLSSEEAHREWIADLLALYYDKAYEYSFRKLPRETVFEGEWKECKQWIQERFA